MRPTALRRRIPLAALALLTGCSGLGDPVFVTRDNGCGQPPCPPASLAPVGRVDGQLLVQPARSAAGRFIAQMIFLADQLERNADRKNLSGTFLVSSFTDLNKLTDTTPLGRLVAESLIHELQVRHWKVFEVRLTKGVVINETGEFSLSRDIRKLRDEYKVGGVVTGTYTVVDGHVVINARVIDINTGIVASTGQVYLPDNWFSEGLLHEPEGGKSLKIIGG